MSILRLIVCVIQIIKFIINLKHKFKNACLTKIKARQVSQPVGHKPHVALMRYKPH